MLARFIYGKHFQDILFCALLHTVFFYDTFMLLAILVIVDADKKYLFKAFQPFGIVPVPDLPDGCLGSLIPLQFHHHGRISCYVNIVFWDKHNVRKTLAGRHFLNDLVLLFSIIVCNQDNESQGLWNCQEMCSQKIPKI